MIARTSSATWVKGVVEMFSAEGLDVPSLFDAAGLDLAALADPAARFQIDDISVLWELAVARSGKQTLGLSRQMAANHGNLDVVAHAMLTCETLLEGLQRLTRYMNVVSNAATFVLTANRSGGHWLELGHMGGDRPVPRQRVEFGMLTVLAHCSWITGRDLRAQTVEFVYPEPAEARAHEAAFECTVRFAAAANRAHLREADLALPLFGRNKTLAVVHEKLAEQRMESLEGTKTSQRVQELIAARVAERDLGRDCVAALCMSSRTLQRRLEEEGTSFQKLRDDTRRELAQRFLREAGNASLSRVAERLGFEDQSNLFRACKRWFGESPGSYRARLDPHRAD